MTELPPFAILFKTHFWDDFVLRQLHRLQEQAWPGHIFLVLDETKAPIDAIEYPRVLRLTEQMSADAGYRWEPRGNLFWYNTDYQLYHFIDRHPSYRYIVTCEYDCVVNIPLSRIVETMVEHDLGFVGERIRPTPSEWYWAEFARPYYPEGTDIVGRLLCFAAFSRDFALQLQATRRDHTRRFLAGELGDPAGPVPWPNNEAIVGLEIARLNVPERPLSVFGNVARYDWAPPYPESDLARLSDSAVIHPVLDGRGQMRSMVTKLGWNPELVFQPDSHVRSYFEQCDPDHAVAMLLRHFAETRNWDAIQRLHGYAAERVGDRAPALFNVARGKPATQSSVSPWSVWPDLSRDAAGAVNGRITGGYGFHTHIDPPSWWCVDLQETYPVTEIRIHNRLDVPFRTRTLVVNASTDMMHWQTVYRHEGEWDFGGADGAPLRIRPDAPLPLRFLRLHLEARELLHLDEVEAFV
jgi:hypothetical protein